MSFAVLFVSIVGEELWWRGYVLPHQELSFGRHTWLIHGLLWTGFHASKWWDLISLLPLCLGLSYLVSRLENNTPGPAMHTLQKADFFSRGGAPIPVRQPVKESVQEKTGFCQADPILFVYPCTR